MGPALLGLIAHVWHWEALLKTILSTALLINLLSGHCVLAQTNYVPESIDEVTEVLIQKKITRSDRSQSLNKLDLEQQSFMTLPGALEGVKGAHIIRNGGQGQPTSVSIRGSASDEIVVLWDGARLNDPSLVGGGVNLGLISHSGASQIDIINGPAGAQWGAGATGGVILIQPSLTSNFLQLEGAQEHHLVSLSLTPKWKNSRSVIHLMNASDAASSAAASGDEHDKFSQTQAYLRLGSSALSEIDWKIWALTSNSLSQYDGFPAPFYELSDTDDYGRLSSLGVGGNLSVKTSLGLLSYRTHQYESQRQTFNEGQTGFSSEARVMENELTLAPLDHRKDWLIGLNNQSDEMKTLSPNFAGGFNKQEASQSQWSLFLMGSHAITSKTKLTGAWRGEINEATIDQNYHLSLNHIVKPALRFGASLATGHKRPSLFQRFSEYSKPDLKPETSLMTEAFWQYQSSSISVDLSLYERWSEDLIVFASCYNSTTSLCSIRPYGHYDNLNKVNHQGFEFSFSHRSKRAQFSMSHSGINPRQKAGDNRGKDLPRSPRSLGIIQYNRHLSQTWKLNLRAKSVGAAFDDARNQIKLTAFSDLSLGIIYSPSGPVEWVFRGENLGNSRQITAFGYSGPVHRLSVGIKVKL